MKIIGLTYYFGEEAMVLKCDSCLLNGRKPMFIPDHTKDLRYGKVVIARISRLGKHIEPKFASRYYDALAPGYDFVAYDRLEEARAKGDSWAEAIAFDYSLAIGEWTEGSGTPDSGKSHAEPGTPDSGKNYAAKAIEEAISKVSQLMTIRQGDLIYVAVEKELHQVEKEQVLREEINGEEKLYCKIK